MNSDYLLRIKSPQNTFIIVCFQHGELKDVRLVTYRSGQSKGLAYIEYVDEVSVSEAVCVILLELLGKHDNGHICLTMNYKQT